LSMEKAGGVGGRISMRRKTQKIHR
jgi:hypothetical protein